LLDYIIGDRFHVEIFKRAVVIIKFLASEGALADHHIDQLWKYTSDSQEGSVKTVYKTFVELSSEASVEVNNILLRSESIELGLHVQ